jgi:predicted secreted protein
MAILAAHASKIHIAATDTTGEVTGLDSVEWSPSATKLVITDFADTSAAQKVMTGLKDFACTLSGHYNSADTAQALLHTLWASGADVYLRYLPDGSTGFKVVCKVTDYKFSGGVDETVKASYTLTGNGAIAAV